MTTAITSYQDYTGQDIQLAKIREFIAQTCPQATQPEVDLFIARCQASRLNPFIRDAYLVKYGSQPASIIVSKDALVKRADRMEQFDGMEHGVTILTKDGRIVEREGQAYYRQAGETLIGAWCKVYRKDRSHPATAKVSLDEFDKKKAQWNLMPAVMIDKVAQVTAIRQAFPQDFAGMYEPAEMGGEASAPQAVEATVEAPAPTPAPVPAPAPAIPDEDRELLSQYAGIVGDKQRVWEAYKAGGINAAYQLALESGVAQVDAQPEPEQDTIEF